MNEAIYLIEQQIKSKKIEINNTKESVSKHKKIIPILEISILNKEKDIEHLEEALLKLKAAS